MKNGEIENLLDELSSGLKADPEMRLDIKSELRAHLDDKIAEGKQSGLSETESSKQALKSFGDIVTIADGLVEANTPRMKLKARLWRLATILMFPTVVICALASFYPVLENIVVFKYLGEFSLTNPLGSSTSWIQKLVKLHDKSYSADEKLILYGDTTKKNNWQKQKALCDKFPNNKVYWANYILQLISARTNKAITKEQIFTELKRAQAIEPDNAFYNYLTAGLLLDDACSYKTQTKSIKDGLKKRKSFNETVDFKVKNRQLLEQAMQEYMTGTRKKYCRSYTIQLLHQRLKIMGQPTSLATSLKQMILSASTRIPHFSLYRQTAKVVPRYTQLLINGKQREKALQYMHAWQPYLQHQLADSEYVIGSLIIIASAKEFKLSLPRQYKELGETQQAKLIEQQLQQIINIKENWVQARKGNAVACSKKGGVLAGMLLPALGIQLNEKDLAPSRRIEYLNIEKCVIAVLNILFMGGILLAIVVIFFWRWHTGTKAILLTPPIHTLGKILLWGIIVPISSYLLISALGIIGGHEYGFIYNSAILFQILLLMIFIPRIIFYLAQKQVITRCQQLNISFPEQKSLSKTRKIILWIIIAILGITAIVPYITTDFIVIWLITIFLAIIYVLLLIVNDIANFIISIKHREYAIYYGALAKTLLPIFALAVVFLTFSCIPYLNWQEASLIKQDKVIFGSPATFTPAEAMAIAKLKNQLAQALKPRVQSSRN